MNCTPSGCKGYRAFPSGSGPHTCCMPIRAIIIAGCEHEHISPRDLCDMHAEDAREGRMLCGDCLDSRNPHLCQLRVMSEATP